MRFDLVFLFATLLTDASVGAVALPASDVAQAQPPHEEGDSSHELWKRKGGGHGGGRGGGGGSVGGSSGGGRSGSGSGSGDSGSGSGSSGGRTGSGSSSGSSGSGKSGSSGGRALGSSSSQAGGRTTTGSGPRPAFGSGRYYGGGAAVPYRSGARSPSGIAPAFFVLGALAFWPGLWLHPAYLYDYNQPYTFHNATTGRNETKPVVCGCDETVECGCDDNTNTTYMNSLIGNGSYAALNRSVVNVADVNGSNTILVNGTLPNGTTASGGDVSPSDSAAAGLRALLHAAGWWPVVATVAAAVFIS